MRGDESVQVCQRDFQGLPSGATGDLLGRENGAGLLQALDGRSIDSDCQALLS